MMTSNWCAAAPSTDDTMKTVNEFYQVNEDVVAPKIDKEGTALCGGAMTVQRA
jgi:hypothetical protein